MPISRALLAIVAAGLLLAGGCTSRQDKVLIQELRAENARLTQELNALQETARELETERNYAREENQRLREHIKGMERQLVGLGDTNIPGMQLTDRGSLALDQDFFFKSGSADITTEGEAAIARLAQQLKGGEYAGTTVIVEGHTDDTPVSRAATREKFGDNWGLSAMRAAEVIRVLQAKGISPQRLQGAFRGEYQPAVSNSSRDNKAKNRRVEIFLTL